MCREWAKEEPQSPRGKNCQPNVGMSDNSTLPQGDRA